MVRIRVRCAGQLATLVAAERTQAATYLDIATSVWDLPTLRPQRAGLGPLPPQIESCQSGVRGARLLDKRRAADEFLPAGSHGEALPPDNCVIRAEEPTRILDAAHSPGIRLVARPKSSRRAGDVFPSPNYFAHRDLRCGVTAFRRLAERGCPAAGRKNWPLQTRKGNPRYEVRWSPLQRGAGRERPFLRDGPPSTWLPAGRHR